jgi:hypothetical protein
MNIKLDENINAALIPVLSDLGHEVDSVPQEGLTGRPDPEVWAGAQGNEREIKGSEPFIPRALYPPAGLRAGRRHPGRRRVR